MKMWLACSLDIDGNLIEVGKVAYRDGHPIKCTLTLMAKNGEVTRDDDDLKVIKNGCGYAAFVPVALRESFSVEGLVKAQESQVEPVAEFDHETAENDGRAVALVGAATGGEFWQ